MLRPALLLIALMLTVAVPARAGPATGVRSEAPIRQSTLSNGARRFAVPVQVGATTLMAALDTGSTGLRILPGALRGADAAPTADPETYGYASGSRYEGLVGEARLSIGGAHGTGPVHLIQTIGCYAYLPHCPASRTTLAQYGVASDGLPGEGFKAILGIDMAPGRVGNPLRFMGVRRWIVELPRPGEGDGRLVLNPTEAETEGYVMIPLAAPYAHERGGGLHDAVPGCLSNPASHARACGVVLMDTGGAGLQVANGRLGETPWPDGAVAALELFDTTGGVAARAALTVGLRDQGTRMSFRQERRVTGVVIYAGIAPYFAYSVLYDARRQMIGLKPRHRAPPPMRREPSASRRSAEPVARETSAGVLAYRRRDRALEFLLVHPGGPYWAGKDEAAWSIPKGLVDDGEETWAAARREFAEELGQPIEGEAAPLTPCPTSGGKLILAWLVEADLDVAVVRSNDFEIEWPPRSGQRARFPEVDRAAWFDPETALWKVHKGQRPILTEAVSRLKT